LPEGTRPGRAPECDGLSTWIARYSLHPFPSVALRAHFDGAFPGLKALRSFFSHMATDSGLAFVVIVHLSPDHESRMATLLQRFTSMPVVQVSDTVKVEANRVYVIPPAKHLSLTDGQLCLPELLPEREGESRSTYSFARFTVELPHLGENKQTNDASRTPETPGGD
jgi:CheB methylesterase